MAYWTIHWKTMRAELGTSLALYAYDQAYALLS